MRPEGRSAFVGGEKHVRRGRMPGVESPGFGDEVRRQVRNSLICSAEEATKDPSEWFTRLSTTGAVDRRPTDTPRHSVCQAGVLTGLFVYVFPFGTLSI